MEYLFNGFIIGLAYLAPIGAQNIYVINAALKNTIMQSLWTVTIVTFFDITLALGCFYGIGHLISTYAFLKPAIIGVGSTLLLYIAYGLITSAPPDLKTAGQTFSTKEVFIVSIVVTWFNPQALIDGTMMLGAFQAVLPEKWHTHFISGVLLASLCWFTGLTTVTRVFSRFITPRILHRINQLCGLIIAGYALSLGYKLFM